MTRRPRFAATLFVIIGSLGLAACQMNVSAGGYRQGSGPGGSNLVTAPITHPISSQNWKFLYSGSGTSVSVTHPSQEGPNERDAFWFSNAPVAQDEESCSTWDSSSGTTQRGEMLHMTRSAKGTVRGIAVVDNIWQGGKWLFMNYAIAGNSKNAVGDIYEGFDLSFVLGGKTRAFTPLPWHECARTLGGHLQFVVWTGKSPRPAYGTPGASGSIAIPSAYDKPGMAGWYVGHITDGTVRLSGLTTRDLDHHHTASTGR
jgi:hypothetical protein